MTDDIVILPRGWCCYSWSCPRPVGCECVRVRGIEMCVPHAAVWAGLPEDSPAERVVEVLREVLT